MRSRVVANVKASTLRAVIAENTVMASTTLHTDTASAYATFSGQMAGHEAVNHGAGEYVRNGVSTNLAEAYFSQFKRSLDGTHHHVSVDHLDRYLAEFDFRYTTRGVSDTERMDALMGQVAGRRVSYR